jgi:pimeloyl-ACP methyl ester carboxylesterase
MRRVCPATDPSADSQQPFINVLRQRAYSFNGLKRAIADEHLLTPEFIAKAQLPPSVLAAVRQIGLTTPPSLCTPTCPTLVMWGEQDRWSAADDGRRVVAEINNAKFTAIPHSAHMPQIEQSEVFLQVALPFLLGAIS